MTEPLFRAEGSRFVPTEHTRGPWDPRAQHGGPAAALLARSIEALPSTEPMLVARFSMEILRPIPLEPMEVSARLERAGNRVQLAGATLRAGDLDICRVSAWRVRRREVPAPRPVEAPEAVFPPPHAGSNDQVDTGQPAFHVTGVETSFVRGHFAELGPSTVWIRLRRPVLDGEEPSPLQRVLAAADFGNGVSAVLDWNTSLFINTELTVHLFREPAGEWICLDARTHIGPDGAGLAESALHDEQGRIGRAAQALYVQAER